MSFAAASDRLRGHHRQTVCDLAQHGTGLLVSAQDADSSLERLQVPLATILLPN
jgi:hypothetical protein